MKHTATASTSATSANVPCRPLERPVWTLLTPSLNPARVLALGWLCAGLFLGPQAMGQTTYVWDGGTSGAGTTWNATGNWAPDGAPPSSSNSNLLFDNRNGNPPVTLPSTLFVNSTRSVGQVTFDNANGVLPATLSIGNNFTDATVTPQTLTIFSGITLRNTTTQVNFVGGTVTPAAGGILSLALGANNTFTTSASSLLQINSSVTIGGGFGITTAGLGAVGLNAQNTFTGGVTVGGGTTLRIGTTTSGTVSVGMLVGGQTGTGTLILQDGATFSSNSTGSRSVQNNVSMAGNLTLGATATFTGPLTFNSISSANETLTTPATMTMTGNTSLTANVNTSIANVIGGGFGLTTAGPGAVSLSALNTFTGGITVAGGATLRAGASSTVVSGSISGGALGTGLLTLQSGATLTPTGTIDRTFQNSLSLAGNVTLGASSTFTGNLTFDSTGLTTPATVTLTGNTTLTTHVATLFENVISGVGFSLTKEGVGNLTLDGTNTYSGVTTVASGTLRIGASGSMGASSGLVNLGRAGGGNASLISYLAGFTYAQNIEVVAGSGGTLTLGTSSTFGATSIFSGAITLNDALQLTSVAPSGFSVRLSGPISGSSNITKTGVGMVQWTNNNTGYSGTTTISAGILQLGTNAGSTAGGLGTGGVINNAALSVFRSNTVALANAISGTGSFNQSGAGTTRLTSLTNSYTGATNVSAGTLEIAGSISGTTSVSLTGGTLLLSGSSESINDSAALSLATSTRVGFAVGLSNRIETFNSLDLLGNAILDFGNGNTNRFAFTSGISGLNASTLSIYNWSSTSGSEDVLALSNTLGDAELGNIRFFSDGAGADFLGTGGQIAFGGPAFQIVPVPEPSSTALLGAAGLLGLIGFRERRRFFATRGRRAVESV